MMVKVPLLTTGTELNLQYLDVHILMIMEQKPVLPIASLQIFGVTVLIPLLTPMALGHQRKLEHIHCQAAIFPFAKMESLHVIFFSGVFPAAL